MAKVLKQCMLHDDGSGLLLTGAYLDGRVLVIGAHDIKCVVRCQYDMEGDGSPCVAGGFLR